MLSYSHGFSLALTICAGAAGGSGLQFIQNLQNQPHYAPSNPLLPPDVPLLQKAEFQLHPACPQLLSSESFLFPPNLGLLFPCCLCVLIPFTVTVAEPNLDPLACCSKVNLLMQQVVAKERAAFIAGHQARSPGN